MWKYDIKDETFNHKLTGEVKMFYMTEDFGEHGHTCYNSAGLLKGESKDEVISMLTLMLIDSSDGLENAIQNLKDTYNKHSTKKKVKKAKKAKKK